MEEDLEKRLATHLQPGHLSANLPRAHSVFTSSEAAKLILGDDFTFTSKYSRTATTFASPRLSLPKHQITCTIVLASTISILEAGMQAMSLPRPTAADCHSQGSSNVMPKSMAATRYRSACPASPHVTWEGSAWITFSMSFMLVTHPSKSIRLPSAMVALSISGSSAKPSSSLRLSSTSCHLLPHAVTTGAAAALPAAAAFARADSGRHGSVFVERPPWWHCGRRVWVDCDGVVEGPRQDSDAEILPAPLSEPLGVASDAVASTLFALQLEESLCGRSPPERDRNRPTFEVLFTSKKVLCVMTSKASPMLLELHVDDAGDIITS
mmetsp:Transcript_132712/g.424756  ORF Transcript_132712/g.424756 Transcript_132712/m.424756 type:complete len:324 (-) Transcript_132712:37-1008(-)